MAPRSPGRSGPWEVITLDQLALGDRLASGAMGVVCAATWRGRRVAVKTLHDSSPEALHAVQEELMVHAALQHERVVALHGANLSPPGCCIVMEQCECSLFERLHRHRDAPERRACVGIAVQVAEGMAHLHSRSPPIVHRDLKSHNVLLDARGSAKLCDFGLVNSREVTAGTPNYMAPELFASKPYSVKVDVFAFAVLLNEMLSREVPWDGYQPLDIKDKVLAGERPPVAKTVPVACGGLLRKAWHTTPALRPHFEALIGTLRTIEENLPLGSAALGCSSRMRMGDSLDEFASLKAR